MNHLKFAVSLNRSNVVFSLIAKIFGSIRCIDFIVTKNLFYFTNIRFKFDLNSFYSFGVTTAPFFLLVCVHVMHFIACFFNRNFRSRFFIKAFVFSINDIIQPKKENIQSTTSTSLSIKDSPFVRFQCIRVPICLSSICFVVVC